MPNCFEINFNIYWKSFYTAQVILNAVYSDIMLTTAINKYQDRTKRQ
jgi:hypothetical protein